MIDPDTNVLVRYLVQDDSKQAAAARLIGPKRSPVAEHAGLAWRALRARGAAGADLSDALIGAVVAARRDTKIVTFDSRAAKLPGYELLA